MLGAREAFKLKGGQIVKIGIYKETRANASTQTMRNYSRTTIFSQYPPESGEYYSQCCATFGLKTLGHSCSTRTIYIWILKRYQQHLADREKPII